MRDFIKSFSEICVNHINLSTFFQTYDPMGCPKLTQTQTLTSFIWFRVRGLELGFGLVFSNYHNPTQLSRMVSNCNGDPYCYQWQRFHIRPGIKCGYVDDAMGTSRCWGGTYISGLLGVMFVEDAWWWQSIRWRAGTATCNNAVEARKWVIRGRRRQADATGEQHRSFPVGRRCVSRRLSVIRRRHHRPALLAFGDNYQPSTSISTHGKVVDQMMMRISRPLVFSVKMSYFFDLYESIYGKCLCVVLVIIREFCMWPNGYFTSSAIVVAHRRRPCHPLLVSAVLRICTSAFTHYICRFSPQNLSQFTRCNIRMLPLDST